MVEKGAENRGEKAIDCLEAAIGRAAALNELLTVLVDCWRRVLVAERQRLRLKADMVKQGSLQTPGKRQLSEDGSFLPAATVASKARG
jgi:hypothetical protein